MSIKVPKQVPQASIEPGSYIARCYSMIHIGTNEYEWQGEKKQANKFRITFEFPTETKTFKEEEGPKPLVLSAEYTLSLGKKAKLRPILEAWRGKPFTDAETDDFDVTKLAGVPALVTVMTNEKGYSEIASITKPPKGMECPPQVNPTVILDYDNFSTELFNKLPDFLKAKIQTSIEYRKMTGTYKEESTDIEEMAMPHDSHDDVDGIPF